MVAVSRWPDFLTFYTSATGASWIVPTKYVEKVGDKRIQEIAPGEPGPANSCRCRSSLRSGRQARALGMRAWPSAWSGPLPRPLASPHRAESTSSARARPPPS